VARTLRAHYFEARKQYSSGIVEGLNSKVKLTLKRACGFRTADAREVALFHALRQLEDVLPLGSFSCLFYISI